MEARGFLRHEANGIPYYSCAAWEDIPWLRHGFSTRLGGVGDGADASLNLSHLPWDLPVRVEENRRRLLSALDLAGVPLANLSQIHSDRLHIITEYVPSQGHLRPEGDALATRTPRIALAVQVADCLPVLIADVPGRAVAAVHAGWRGTTARILQKTLGAMKDSLGSDQASLQVAIGPGIRSCCLEVGFEVADLFEAEFPGAGLAKPRIGRLDKRLLDLAGALVLQCAASGVRLENVHDIGACTRCNPAEFFSYRAEGARAGRMMGVIAISE